MRFLVFGFWFFFPLALRQQKNSLSFHPLWVGEISILPTKMGKNVIFPFVKVGAKCAHGVFISLFTHFFG